MPGTGGWFDPRDGGATPIIVPFSFGLGPAAGAMGPAGAPGAGAAGAAGGAPGAGAAGAAGPPGRGTAAGGAFIMSIVPLNFGAAVAGLSAKPHFAHAVAVSRFWAPQFGQNTEGYLLPNSQNSGAGGRPAYTGLLELSTTTSRKPFGSSFVRPARPSRANRSIAGRSTASGPCSRFVARRCKRRLEPPVTPRVPGGDAESKRKPATFQERAQP
jgi:hypothetical protein